MLNDFFLPPGLEPPTATAEGFGVRYRRPRWTPGDLALLATRLSQEGAAALAQAGPDRLLAAWDATVAAFLDPASPERRRLDPVLAACCGLSPAGLAAGLEAVLGGVRPGAARQICLDPRAAAARTAAAGHSGLADPRPVLVILASNLPALAVQPLLPILALGRPAILKSPSAEPFFAAAFAAALAAREPALGRAVAALTWRGGDAALEAPLLAAAGTVMAYGEAETLEDLGARAAGKLVGYGPKTSLALVGRAVAGEEVAPGLARDVALFDQRGCLSVAAVYTAGDAGKLARQLAAALAREAVRLPPGPAQAAAAAGVQQVRAEAQMRGLVQPPLPLEAGTVVVEPEGALRPSPGLRTVRIHPVAELAAVPPLLAPWRNRLQGAALAGEDAWELTGALTELGLSRFAPPGELQHPDATWHNGGVHPLEALRTGTDGTV